MWLFPLGVMGQLVITTEGKRSPAEKDTTKHKRGEKRERPRCGFYEPRLSSNNSPFTCDPNVDIFFTWVERKEDDPNSMGHLVRKSERDTWDVCVVGSTHKRRNTGGKSWNH